VGSSYKFEDPARVVLGNTPQLAISSIEAVCFSGRTCESYEPFGKDSVLDGELLALTCFLRRGASDE